MEADARCHELAGSMMEKITPTRSAAVLVRGVLDVGNHVT